MDVEVDHYSVLGLPTGEEGAKLSEKEISKAYRAKALELHPDKRLDDPNAHANFQKLKSSYEILKDDKARKLFDDLLRVKADQQRRQLQKDAKRRRMVSDLEERERAAFETDPAVKAELEERRILKKLKEEIDRIRAMHSNKATSTSFPNVQTTGDKGTPKTDTSEVAVDMERTLKVSWEKLGPDYTAERLRTLFSVFGAVEDVVTRKTKKRGSALVVMSSKDAATSALGNVIGDLSNPLLVVPLESKDSSTAREPPSVNNDISKERLNTLVGAGYQDYEDSVMRKLQQAAARQKQCSNSQMASKEMSCTGFPMIVSSCPSVTEQCALIFIPMQRRCSSVLMNCKLITIALRYKLSPDLIILYNSALASKSSGMSGDTVSIVRNVVGLTAYRRRNPYP